jgi:cyclic pyranopterin monophosphate synthase
VAGSRLTRRGVGAFASPDMVRPAILDAMDHRTDRAPAPRSERRRLSHVDRTGRPRMVDVSAKPSTDRRAVAEASVAVSPETMSLVIDGGGAKGDVLSVAELAGVMGAKRTSELIPLCHPLSLTDVQVTITPDRAAGALRVRAEAATTGQTGVEMEAMTAASVAALTVYDMVKGVERGVEIQAVRLLSKSGGKSGHWTRSPSDAPSGGGHRPGDRTAGRIAKPSKPKPRSGRPPAGRSRA